MAIAIDASVGRNTVNASSSTANLTHAANVLVLIAVSENQSTTSVQSVTVGATSATFLVGVNSGVVGRFELWYAFVSASGTDTITVTWPSGRTHSWSAVSFTGTRTVAPFFEGTVTGNGSGGTPQTSSATIAAGTSGRRITHFAGGICYGSSAHTLFAEPAAGQTEIIDTDTSTYVVTEYRVSCAEMNYRDDAAERLMSAVLTKSIATNIYWGAIVTAILVGVVAPTVTTQAADGIGLD